MTNVTKQIISAWGSGWCFAAAFWLTLVPGDKPWQIAIMVFLGVLNGFLVWVNRDAKGNT